MFKMKKIFAITAILFAAVMFLGGQDWEMPDPPNPFMVPDNLKDNVAFWKKIYTEVSLTEGLIHDSEYPLVIYKKITIGKLRGRSRRRVVRKHMNDIIRIINNLNRKHPPRWGDKEKEIADLFKQHADMSKLKTARSRMRFQQGQEERFKEGVERSGAYLDYIRTVFKEYDIPLRIAYLPHVESSFNINAYSKVGAAGMWQFMRRTGRLFMTVNYKIDERRDPLKSTVAAAKLLKRNYEELKSWPLAITAYNHGPESIKRAVRLTGTRDLGVIIEKYKNRRFRFASKNFYSCFLAASEIGANPARYFPDLNYHPAMKYNEVVLDSYIRPAVLSKHLDINQKELARLNPSLRTTIFHRQMTIPRGFHLRIPATLSPEDAVAKMTGIPGAQKSTKSPDYYYYSVRRGDTLFRIARRFRVSTQTLLASNNIRRKNRIYVGQVLRIPGKTGTPTAKTNKTIEPQKTQETPTRTTQTKPEVKPKTSITHKPPRVEMKIAEILSAIATGTFDATLYSLDLSYFPQKGTARIQVEVDETLGHYADWLGIPTSWVRRLNGFRGQSIRVNQNVLLPVKDEILLAQFKARRLEYHMALEEDFYNQYEIVGVRERKVRYGETLWSICSNSGSEGSGEIPLWLFKKYNRPIDIKSIRKNTKIKLPIVKNKEENNGSGSMPPRKSE
jgi:membrane-bound lytic murein transglycosylase D